jgi:DNA-binding NarL/FixJ family response regulator
MAFEGSDRLLGIVTSPKPLLELIAHQCAGVISHRALAQILKGIVYVPPSIATPSTAGSADESAPAESEVAPTLTPRQKDVLTLVVKGNSNKEIARELGLGEGTVKVHLASLFRTLRVHSRSAAAAKGAVIVWENGRSIH